MFISQQIRSTDNGIMCGHPVYFSLSLFISRQIMSSDVGIKFGHPVYSPPPHIAVHILAENATDMVLSVATLYISLTSLFISWQIVSTNIGIKCGHPVYFPPPHIAVHISAENATDIGTNCGHPVYFPPIAVHISADNVY